MQVVCKEEKKTLEIKIKLCKSESFEKKDAVI